MTEEREELWKELRLCRSMDDYSTCFAELVQTLVRCAHRYETLAGLSSVSPIIGSIDRNLTQHISLSMIAAEVHMSENYISRLFQSETGMNIVNYINRMKMERARRLLCEAGSTVRGVAADVGFYEPSYFIKLFRRIFAVGPGEYKSFLEDRRAAPLLREQYPTEE